MRFIRRGGGFGEFFLKFGEEEVMLMSGIREKAFVSSEFKDYNPRVEYHCSKLIEVIRKTEEKEVNAEKLLENLVFDM
jgi:hypothetical protein